MVRRKPPRQGDVYWVDPNPVEGREMKDRHRYVVIASQQINALGTCMMIPVTSGGTFSREAGICVVVSGHEINGVAVCNQIRSFDLEHRVRTGSARFIETLDRAITNEIVSKVLSVIDLQD